VPASGSDSEVVGDLFRLFGARAATMMDGKFACVVLDKRSGTVFAARDHMGICPMYMAHGTDGSVWFASEMKCFVGEPRIASYELFPPGHVYTKREGEPATLERWYSPQWLQPSFAPSAAADPARLRDLLISAVVKRMSADVPFGVLLSGGLDSSLVASIAVRHGRAALEGNAARGLGDKAHTFSVGIKGAPDLLAARKVASFLGTTHHEFTFTPQEALDALPDVVWHLESFEQIRAAVPLYLLSRKIKALGFKMVLSGEGADEMFAGYLYFHKAPSAQALHEECVRKTSRLHQWDVLRANKATAAWGIEARVPFLDRALVDFSMGECAPEAKTIDLKAKPDGAHPKLEKFLLRSAFDDPAQPYLPAEVLWRQKEQFSDGVGYDWVDSLRAHAEARVSDQQFAERATRFPSNPPETKEYYLLRSLFEERFPDASALATVPTGKSVACSTPEALSWDPRWAASSGDISGRAVDVHESAGGFSLQTASAVAAQARSAGARLRPPQAPARVRKGRGARGPALLRVCAARLLVC